MSRPTILGTAGHIDHGKTSLIKRLTGIDTDRLKEEKKRGITIELGFAYLTLPSGARLGIVDVPGHERFVKNMVAGATGIDIVAMVIAADEGVMPQTREHMEICQMLGLERGLVVLTKVDLVDEDWLALVEDDVANFVQGTFLEDAEMVRFSAASGEGAQDVLASLDRLTEGLAPRPRGSLFRLPIDRVFTMKGFGTVVTGTAASGSLALGETVQLFPGRVTAKVRGLEVHNQEVAQTSAGLRTAVNLQGLEKEEAARGQVLAPVGSLLPGKRLDAALTYLGSNAKPLPNRAPVRFHAGTAEVMGRVLLLDAEELKPGGRALVQLVLEAPVACLGRDHFVLRSYSPVRTIGGGVILNPYAPRHKRFRPEVTARLALLETGAPEDKILALIEMAQEDGLAPQGVSARLDIGSAELKKALDQLKSSGRVKVVEKDSGRMVAAGVLEDLSKRLAATLAEHHAKFPLREGPTKEELKGRIGALKDEKLRRFLLAWMEKEGRVRLSEESVRLPDHEPRLAGQLKQIEETMAGAFAQAGLSPPNLKDVTAGLPGAVETHKEVLGLLLARGVLARVSQDLIFHTSALEEAEGLVRSHFASHQELTTPQFKEMTGLSRKYLIPLLEYFDARGLTMRVGETRLPRRAVR